MKMLILYQIDSLGHRFCSNMRSFYEMFLMVYLSFRATFNDKSQGFRTILSVVSAQIYFTGFQALPLISLIAFASGSIVIIQASTQLSFLGGSGFLTDVLVAVIIRELGPIVTALIVIARSGTAVATELGNMKVNCEVEALEVMGIHPLSYIVFPRVLGGVISVFCLAFYFNIIALFGGFMTAQYVNPIPFSYYIESLASSLTMTDFMIFAVKNTFSGTAIFVIACYMGLKVQKSSHEVPQMTTKAVVTSIVYVVGFNMILTLAFYVQKLSKMGVL